MRKQIDLDRDSGDNVTKITDPQKISVLLTRQQHRSLAVH